MNARYWITFRGIRGSIFYCVDTTTGERTSLQTRDRAAAREIVVAKNHVLRNLQLNLQLARTHLAGSDSGVSTRTWQNALDALVETKQASTEDCWVRAAKERALDLIRHKVIIETQAEHLLECIKIGTVVESCIGAHRVNSSFGTNISVAYWRERNHEVDFVCNRAGQRLPSK